MDQHKKTSETILKLLSNRVCRSYTGGALIGQWQGKPDATDNDKPEEWLASSVEARNKNYVLDEGLSKVVTAPGREEKLADLIAADPEGFLGKAHIAKYGANTAVLTKILDAAVRLSIQVHPTKAYARKFFHSEYGKTEAWYILGGRVVNGEPPYVLLGFKPGITRELWEKYFNEQDVDAMIGALHKFYVQEGDVFLIEGGLPHAIGSGCFLIEIQEPTDYTMRVERTTFDGGQLPDKLCHQGLGFDAMLDCFNYDNLSREETFKKYAKQPRLRMNENGNAIADLVSAEDTSCFSMSKLSVTTELKLNGGSFKTLIILKGLGKLHCGGESLAVTQGESFVVPAAVAEIVIENTSNFPLEIVACYPPK